MHSTEALSSVRGVQREEQESKELPKTTFTRRVGGQGGRAAFKLTHSPNQESQREERDSVIDAIKQITGAPNRNPWARENDCRGYPRVPLGYRL